VPTHPSFLDAKILLAINVLIQILDLHSNNSKSGRVVYTLGEVNEYIQALAKAKNNCNGT
jgi:hypothetical protein